MLRSISEISVTSGGSATLPSASRQSSIRSRPWLSGGIEPCVGGHDHIVSYCYAQLH